MHRRRRLWADSFALRFLGFPHLLYRLFGPWWWLRVWNLKNSITYVATPQGSGILVSLNMNQNIGMTGNFIFLPFNVCSESIDKNSVSQINMFDYIYINFNLSWFLVTYFCQVLLLGEFHNYQDFLTKTITSYFQLTLFNYESYSTATIRGKVFANWYTRI